MSKVIVGLSGGVDSSVAALLLLEQGYDIDGLFMKNWEEDDSEEYCSAAADLADAMAVADKLGVGGNTQAVGRLKEQVRAAGDIFRERGLLVM